jgi:hypothetical protein
MTLNAQQIKGIGTLIGWVIGLILEPTAAEYPETTNVGWYN